MIALWLAFSDFGRAEEPDCTSAYGKTACGYSCVAAYGDVQCAQTPAGKCEAAFGKITCWDPPAASAPARPGARGRPIRGPSPSAEPAPCVSAYGKTACGYHCEQAYGDVQCAQTAQGACSAAYGQVLCWDPPRPVAPDAPAADCVEAYGKIACGYGCAEGYGTVRCATAPGGVCQAAYGEIICSEARR